MPSNSKRSMAPPATVPKHSSTAGTSNSRPPTQSSSTNAKSSPAPAAPQDARISSPDSIESPGAPTPPTTVNRKKQKRRQKQAARLAAERQSESAAPTPTQNGDSRHDINSNIGGPPTQGQYVAYGHEELDYTDDEAHYSPHAHGHSHHVNNGMFLESHQSAQRKGKKKKGRKSRSHSHQAEGSSTSMSTPSASLARPVALPPLSSSAYRSAHKVTKDRIWNTSTHEERERIKEFWLQLGEEERRSLVKVEKEAVLRKMKEQQKHSCSCTVCGRKRTAIEEELEVLYDAYYEELEQYANHKQGSFENGAPIGAPPRLYQTPLRTLDRHSHHPIPQHPSRGRVQELPDDDEDLDDDYDEDDEDDEPYSEDELEDTARTTRADFFAFGNSLTVKDGILTVADDLLKNDGKHFIDMMEQLAERRMQREEDTQYAAASAAHQSMHGGHNHGPPLDEEEYDEEEEEDYDSQDDEEYEEDEMDAMTEEQRMEEGRRMFQIFAARMFEQRVLTAYREKIARERQERLIQELEEENRLDVEREAKKAREAQKKKDKKRLQKQAKEEEKQKREAERAAEEAAQKALEEKRLEEQRKKKEEQRKKREAEKKAQEEDRLRKEAERQSDLRKSRSSGAAVQAAKRASQSGAAHLPPGLQHPQGPATVHSPHLQVATPVVPKAPTPMRPRQASQQGSHASSPRSQPAHIDISQAISLSPGTAGISHNPGKPTSQPPLLHHPQPSAPLSPFGNAGRGSHTLGFNAMPSINGMPSNAGGVPAMGPRMPIGPDMSMYTNHSGHLGGQFRAFGSPDNIPLPPGITGPRHLGQGRGFPMDTGHTSHPFHSQPGATGALPAAPSQVPHNQGTPLTHTRQPSLPFDRNSLENQPISRPAPIQRPGSTVPHDQHKDESKRNQQEIDELSTQLGSSALLDDSDIPLTSPPSQPLPSTITPGLPGSGRVGFGTPSLFSDPLGSSKSPFPLGAPGSGAGWASHNPFEAPGFPAGPSWGPGSGTGWSANAFGILGGSHRAHTSRPVAIRLSVIQACKQLSTASGADKSGYHNVNQILRHVEQSSSPNEPLITLDEMLDICDTEGNAQNGGGSFAIKNEGPRGTFVKFEPDNNSISSSTRGSIVPGDIGSPVPSSILPAPPGSGPRQFATTNISPTTGF
ncbi:conserved hypothetical protein [Uncinocarpus reesii 1704]|uniref:Stress response protein NST1 n=1 Tax=Uncinocarpus reesii (strain UAMH 1704) TaxID=336963 RepID=C4JYW6_UNCRE|nr:uncharacterized protein UREG_07367 [Uncinocarpus reesii 1704]EEP82502.1 conserved hypothetical protein [Uncinocarpus reesii 1704]